MKEFKKMVCRNMRGEFGNTVIFTSTDGSEIRAYVDKCRLFVDGFENLLANNYSALVCRIEGLQYEFFA